MCTVMRQMRRGTENGRQQVLKKRKLTVRIKRLREQCFEGDPIPMMQFISGLVTRRNAITV